MMLTGFQQSFGGGAKNIVPALVDEVEDELRRDEQRPATPASTDS
jgi:hypothetical protein